MNCHNASILVCDSVYQARVCVKWPVVRSTDTGRRRAAASVRGRRVITVMRMDVFIMSGVFCYPPPPNLFSFSLEQLRLHSTSGRLWPRLYCVASLLQLVSRRGVSPISDSPPWKIKQKTLHLCGQSQAWPHGEVMGCEIWAEKKRFTPGICSFSLSLSPQARTFHRCPHCILGLPSPLYFHVVF